MKKGKHSTSNIQHSTSNGRTDRQPQPTSRGENLTQPRHPTSNGDSGQMLELHEGGEASRQYDLEVRLLEFACAVIDLSEKLPTTRAGSHVAGQILRSGTSPYPNHGEAEDAESREDFIHKMKLCLKELRETRRWARLINRKGWAGNGPSLSYVLRKADELVRIFFSSVRTAKRNVLSERRKLSDSAHYPSGEAG